MEWLTQNWILVVGAVGIFLLMRRGGMGRGHAGGGHHDGSHGHRHDGAAPEGSATQAVDPVSGKQVDPASAVSSLYRGAPVYFESRESRERFEAAPDQFPIAQPAPARQRRRRGC